MAAAVMSPGNGLQLHPSPITNIALFCAQTQQLSIYTARHRLHGEEHSPGQYLHSIFAIK